MSVSLHYEHGDTISCLGLEYNSHNSQIPSAVETRLHSLSVFETVVSSRLKSPVISRSVFLGQFLLIRCESYDSCSARYYVFVYLKNTFWAKRQTNRKQFRIGGESPAQDCFLYFYHHIGPQKSSKLVVIGIWIVIYRGFPRQISAD